MINMLLMYLKSNIHIIISVLKEKSLNLMLSRSTPPISRKNLRSLPSISLSSSTKDPSLVCLPLSLLRLGKITQSASQNPPYLPKFYMPIKAHPPD